LRQRERETAKEMEGDGREKRSGRAKKKDTVWGGGTK